MARTRSGRGSAPARLPSYEELLNSRSRGRHPALTDEANRLRWVLHGPLETAIAVLKQPYHDPDTTPEPYCTSQEGDDDHPAFHAVSQAAYTDPKVSSVTVSVMEIDDWEDQWRENHLSCKDGDEENYDFPSKCCGEKRPRPKERKAVVKASSPGPEGFVTVHDYVSAVHPWLMRKHDDLLRAMAVLTDEPRLSLPAGEHLMVAFTGGNLLSVGREGDWLRNKDKKVHLQVVRMLVEPGEYHHMKRCHLGLFPADKDGNHSELRNSDVDFKFGPWLGFVGPWPPPYEGAVFGDTDYLNHVSSGATVVIPRVQDWASVGYDHMQDSEKYGQYPADRDGNYVEVRGQCDFGPWPGFVGDTWPPPHDAASQPTLERLEATGPGLEPVVNRFGRVFHHMAPCRYGGMYPADKDGVYVELCAPDDEGPWPGYVGPWPIPWDVLIGAVSPGDQGNQGPGS